MTPVIVLIGAGSIGQAIARRVSAGKHVLLADLRPENSDAAAKVLTDAGFDVSTAVVDVGSRASVHALVETATAKGQIAGMIHAAGVSPTQASPSMILKVDLYGTALVTEEFGKAIASGRVGRRDRVAIGSPPSGPDARGKLGVGDNACGRIARAPDAPQLDRITDSLSAYQISKRGNSLRVMAEAVRWGKRGARQHNQSRHHHHAARE